MIASPCSPLFLKPLQQPLRRRRRGEGAEGTADWALRGRGAEKEAAVLSRPGPNMGPDPAKLTSFTAGRTAISSGCLCGSQFPPPKSVCTDPLAWAAVWLWVWAQLPPLPGAERLRAPSLPLTHPPSPALVDPYSLGGFHRSFLTTASLKQPAARRLFCKGRLRRNAGTNRTWRGPRRHPV